MHLNKNNVRIISGMRIFILFSAPFKYLSEAFYRSSFHKIL